jgi:NAD(P)-dependent dehydrogenase (short-subunit alcohol dehydrogenase family)
VTIAPGTFLTPAFRDADPEQLDAYWGAAVPFPKRMGRADEYAKLATHIAEKRVPQRRDGPPRRHAALLPGECQVAAPKRQLN